MSVRSLGLAVCGLAAAVLAGCGGGGNANMKPAVLDDQVWETVGGGDIDLSLWAFDANGDALTYYIGDTLGGGMPVTGSLTESASPVVVDTPLVGSVVTYTPGAGTGVDSFQFYVIDVGGAQSGVATLWVGVNNSAPDGVSQTGGSALTMDEDDNPLSSPPAPPGSGIVITLAATDADSDTDLVFTIFSGPQLGYGTLSGLTQFVTYAEVTYTPPANWNSYEPTAAAPGPAIFTFEVSDHVATGAVGTVEIDVAAVNDVPVAGVRNATTAANSDAVVTLIGTDVDLDDTLTYIIVSVPTNGALSDPNNADAAVGAGGSLLGVTVTYTPSTDWWGQDTFTYKVNDGTVDSNVATVTINVTPPPQSAWAWGLNSSGQLGIGSKDNKPHPTKMNNIMWGSLVDGGNSHSLIVDLVESVWSCGSNERGQLAKPALFQALSPVGAGGGVDISAGFQHTLVLTDTGSVWSCGRNSAGQLGNTTKIDSPNPGVVLFDPPSVPRVVIAVAAGLDHSLALTFESGATPETQVWAWGANHFGQLGLGNLVAESLTPAEVTIPTTADIVDVAAGDDHSMALDADDIVWTWGADTEGQIGDGGLLETVYLPVAVDADIAAIAAGAVHSLALTTGGFVYGWGSNDWGQVGTCRAMSPIPQRQMAPGYTGMAGAVAIAAGGLHSLALTPAGEVFAWGANSYGQSGTGLTVGGFQQPMLVLLNTGADGQNDSVSLGTDDVPIENVLSIGGGRYHSLCIVQD